MNLPGLVPLHCPSSCSVFAMYWVGTLDLAPSVSPLNQAGASHRIPDFPSTHAISLAPVLAFPSLSLSTLNSLSTDLKTSRSNGSIKPSKNLSGDSR